jgi:hypothetical protein
MWRTTKLQPRRQHSERHPTIQDGDPIKVFYFKCQEAASAWLFLAEHGVDPVKYIELFSSQFDKFMDGDKYHEPMVLNTRFSKDFVRLYGEGGSYTIINRGIDYGRGSFDDIKKQMLLSTQEKRSGWCCLCRGTGFIQAIKSDEPITTDGLITMPYRIHCVHHFFNAQDIIQAEKAGGRKKSKKPIGAMPFMLAMLIGWLKCQS